VAVVYASEKNIAVATNHAEEMKLKINYKCTTVEDLTKEEKRFDIILNMEVVEHVDNVPLFLQSTADLLNPEGILMIATLNRTLKSFAFAIVGAEYILRWLPKGTHDWNKFLKPQEIQSHLSNLELLETTGVSYNPLKALWSLSDDMNVNYMMCFKKLS
jgi:2-polyprenyl-6-hydroxyphenyl methylase/3-demethylubiquinone-9 3-methyltransferase